MGATGFVALFCYYWAMGEFIIFLFFALSIFLFFLPVFIAFKRKHTYRWLILLLNVFGLTGFAWLCAFIWALWPKDDFLN